jgi:hypothetical protein
MYGPMRDLPEVSTSWWRYNVALMRASNREIAEFTDSCLIAAQIAMQAAKGNPMSLVETLEILQHNQAMVTKAGADQLRLQHRGREYCRVHAPRGGGHGVGGRLQRADRENQG